ncbi:hypothetical protein CY34DRAFT_800044 [Suillus luteus UH-Slu-Lm8-n1]|uniref:Uncharacterized protein n=1 Tax=Suillus luteus UH-Slu-Lm8-n1 TaxID=930992 RepID=A0A0D0BUJ6_9AGAM|nr:hypothetical protein CY34DRAFT_800044 [Suillus luteus UH-Slu-Lm8-n1]
MGNALVVYCRIPDGSDTEGNINVIILHAAVKSRTNRLRYHVLDTALQAWCDNS